MKTSSRTNPLPLIPAALALAAACVMAACAPAAWAVDVEVQYTGWERLAGDDRFGTAEEIAGEGWCGYDTCDDVVVTAADFPDALSASVLAGVLRCPVRLAQGVDSPSRAFGYYVIGGDGAVDARWDDRNVFLGRVAGDTAADTAVAVAAKARELGAQSGTCIIATRRGYADALSAAPWSYASGSPILLWDGSLSDATLAMAANYENAVIVGGEAAVPGSARAQLEAAGCSVSRIWGEDAQQTSAAVARHAVAAGALTWDHAGFATRDSFPDALTGAALCGLDAAPVLLVTGDDASVAAEVAREARADMHHAYVFGGESAVPADAMAALEAATTGTVAAEGSYAVEFRNFDGTLLSAQQVAAGGMPVEYRQVYTFTGYDFTNWNVTDEYSTEDIEIRNTGDTVTVTTVPQREDGSYVFAGWDTEICPAACDKVYTATYRYLANDWVGVGADAGTVHAGYDTAQTVEDAMLTYQWEEHACFWPYYAEKDRQGKTILSSIWFDPTGASCWTMSDRLAESDLCFLYDGGGRGLARYCSDAKVTRIITDECVKYFALVTNAIESGAAV